MHIVRKALLGSLHSLFTVSLLSFGLLWGIKMVLGTPTVLKESLQKSGVYNVAAKQVLSQNTQKISISDSNGLPTANPQVQAAIEKAFPPSILEQNIGKVIDGTYGWLQGGSNSPQFTLDLSGSTDKLATDLAAYAQTRMATLPACPAGTPVQDIDPLETACRPVGFDPSEIAAKVKENVSSQEFLNQNKLNANTLKNDQGQTIAEQLKGAPTAYKWGVIGIYITGATALLAAIGVILLHFSRREACRRLAKSSIVVGVTLGLMAFLSTFLLHRLATQFVTAGKGHELQAAITTLVQLLLEALRTWWIGYGAAVAIIGIVVLIVLRFTRPQPAVLAQPQPPRNTPLPPADDSARGPSPDNDHKIDWR